MNNGQCVEGSPRTMGCAWAIANSQFSKGCAWALQAASLVLFSSILKIYGKKFGGETENSYFCREKRILIHLIEKNYGFFN